jgi:hypothetical protein
MPKRPAIPVLISRIGNPSLWVFPKHFDGQPQYETPKNADIADASRKTNGIVELL